MTPRKAAAQNYCAILIKFVRQESKYKKYPQTIRKLIQNMCVEFVILVVIFQRSIQLF